MHFKKLFRTLAVATVVVVWGAGLTVSRTALARDATQAASPGDECVTCHSTPGLGMRFTTGEIVSVYVDPWQWEQSVHGSTLQCTACHADSAVYPHLGRAIAHPSPREVGYLTRGYATCGECHQQQYVEYLGSVHAIALRDGQAESAVCSDCHGDHDIEPAEAKRDGLSVRTAVINCGKCHQEEFQQYQNSVHGKALLNGGDPNVPVCVDCHGVHAMGDPTMPGFRRQSPYLCASCHADEALMKEYGLSASVMETYVADFHGTTMRMISSDDAPISAGAAPGVAMCYDCHGVHEIRSMVDAQNPASGDGLLDICQECHENAPQDFPAAWLGHRKPDSDRFPLVFWIQRIYSIVVGGMIIVFVGHIGLDFGKIIVGKLRDERKRRRAE
jgi:nitrate/TMAO reductase-like tetraheme cytochrome c subunit